MRSREQGSALLIVFVFAAIVAITLYMEMPVAVFEAQRQKEQLLIDRGNEYAHAVKLFVRKTGTYPASIEALENTNQMRFLRHRFKDPFTGKDEWRLLHAGPGGVLLDSKVKPIANQQNGNTPTAKAGTNSSFGTSSFGSFGSSDATADQTVVAALPQRPPEIRASTGAPADANAGSEANQNPMTPLLSPGQAELTAGNPPNVNPQNGQPMLAPAGQPAPGQSINPASGQAVSVAPGQNMLAPVGAVQQPQPNGQPNGQAGATAPQPTLGGDAANPNIPMRTLLANPNTPPGQTMFPSSGSTMGRIMSGGIAGVASKAEGHSIKTVNDQSDYSLWEFYYDPSKDLTRGLPAAATPGAAPATTPAGGTANPSTSGFGNPSTFGQAPQNPTPPPQPGATPPPSPTGVPPNPPAA